MKTSELQGAALDWAVAKCEGTLYANGGMWDLFCPSTEWEFGGPIIEREKITTGWFNEWVADPDGAFEQRGPTPLIAAMRCYVASKLSDEIDIPEELK
jgi:hypothetical protein